MNRFSRIRHHVDIKDVKKRHLEETSAKKLEEKRLKEEVEQIKAEYEKKKSDWREELDLNESDWTPVTGSIANSTSQTFTYSQPNFQTGEPNTFTVSGLGGVESLPSSVKVDFGFGESDNVSPPSYNQLALAGYAKPILMKRRDTEDVNPRLDASQEFAQKVGANVMMNARVSDSIREKDIAYEQRQKKIKSLQDKQQKIIDKYKPQFDDLNNKIEKIIARYTSDGFTVDQKVYEDPEYKYLDKQLEKLSDAQDAELDPLQAEINKLRSDAANDYQIPGTKEYKDMQRVPFDEYYKTLHEHDYNKVLMGRPEERWKLMRYWATQHKDGQRKSAMNLSRIKALKTVLDPTTGKPYNFHNNSMFSSSGVPDTQLGEFVREKLKNVGQIHFDHNRLGTSVPYSDLVSKVLQKGSAALNVYVEELNVFEEYMTQVNNLLEKDLKEYKTYLRKDEYKNSSEINRITYKQAENLKNYQDKLNDIKNHKASISGIIPDIRKAFKGNFEPTPTPIKPQIVAKDLTFPKEIVSDIKKDLITSKGTTFRPSIGQKVLNVASVALGKVLQTITSVTRGVVDLRSPANMMIAYNEFAVRGATGKGSSPDNPVDANNVISTKDTIKLKKDMIKTVSSNISPKAIENFKSGKDTSGILYQLVKSAFGTSYMKSTALKTTFGGTGGVQPVITIENGMIVARKQYGFRKSGSAEELSDNAKIITNLLGIPGDTTGAGGITDLVAPIAAKIGMHGDDIHARYYNSLTPQERGKPTDSQHSIYNVPDMHYEYKIPLSSVLNPILNSTKPSKSKAVKRIKSMAKTRRQSLSLDKPIVRRKKES